MRTLLGSRVFELHPGLIDVWWEYERDAILLFIGVPRWLNSWPYKARERLNLIMEGYVHLADEHDAKTAGGGEETDNDAGGASFVVGRSIWFSALAGVIRWFRQYNYEERNIPGFFSSLLFA